MKRMVLRMIGGVMFVVAVVFMSIALTHPELGSVLYIGNLRIGSSVWRLFYLIYFITMSGVFIASFFVGKDKKSN